ncbi:MAG: T9SS type A sorting domain-containing protein [Bacteroidota bacterium]|nr:T9SS type A sorting domain-containing protein [Bacteroidota bacterium]
MKTYTFKLPVFHPIVLWLFCLAPFGLFSQPSIQWQKCFGGASHDDVNKIIGTSDGGYIAIGGSSSTNGDVTGGHGGEDVWVVKLDASFAIQWQKTFGGTGNETGISIIQTNEGGYLFTGATQTINDGDVVASNYVFSGPSGPGLFDAWIVKIDNTGTIQWQKRLGGGMFDCAETAVQTVNGDYLIAASTNSWNGDITDSHDDTTDNALSSDVWLIKLDVSGGLLWKKSYGGSKVEAKNSLLYYTNLSSYKGNFISLDTTSTGGFIIGTASASADGDVINHHGPTTSSDYWIFTIDGAGTIQWQNSFGGDGNDAFKSIIPTADGGYLAVGSSTSTNGNVTGNHGGGDGWIMKLDAAGQLQWQKCFGGTAAETINSAFITGDGGYFLSGNSLSANGDVSINLGMEDIWIIKTDASGNLQWQKVMGGTQKDLASSSAWQTSDNGFIVTGLTASNDFTVNGINHNSGGTNYDFWIAKLSPMPTHIISGVVYGDLNGNCIKEAGEVGLQGKIVKAMPGYYYTTTDANGNYTLFVDSGSYVVDHTPSSYYSQSCPSSSGNYNVTINYITPNSYGNNFSDTIISNCTDLTVSIASGLIRPCFATNYAIAYANTGVSTANNVSVSLDLDPSIVPLSSSIPWTIVGTQYIFNVGTVLPGQTGSITLTNSISCQAVLGSLKCVSADITTTDFDCDTSNNLNNYCIHVTGSYDPNTLEVESQIATNGFLIQEDISTNDTLNYLIQFQNTGTDTAFTVVVRDTLSNYLDGSTIEMGATSHPYTFRIYGQGICEWTFENILLPDSTTNEVESHGFIRFSIKQNPGNSPGTTIQNGSAIWFDYNLPVETNTTINYIPVPVNIESQIVAQSINAYPNPTNGLFTLELDTDAQIMITNVLGETISSTTLSKGENKIDLQNNTNGIYFIKIMQYNKQEVIKIIKH